MNDLEKIASIHNQRQVNAYARGAGAIVGTVIGITIGITAVLGVLGGCLYFLRWVFR